MSAIESLRGSQVLDSRGVPTVEVDVRLRSGARGRAAAPSGASTGRFEARGLRDDGRAWLGRGVSGAVANVNGPIAEAIVGLDAADQQGVDAALSSLDGTAGLHRLGANAVLAVSLASAHAAATDAGMPLWRHLAADREVALPVPMMNVLEGGRHGDGGLRLQDVMIVPVGAGSFSEAVRMGAETYRAVGGCLARRSLRTTVGDAGGFNAWLPRVDDALDVVLEAIDAAGYHSGDDVALALDGAATELADSGGYRLGDDDVMSGEALVGWWAGLCSRYPIVAIEDPLGEEDWGGWRELTRQLRGRALVVGDDLFSTRPTAIRSGIDEHLATAALIKPDQVGTLSLALRAVRTATDGGLVPIMAHRAGETEHTTTADLAVGAGCSYIKAGGPCRSEHVAKYNRLLRIEESLGWRAALATAR